MENGGRQSLGGIVRKERFLIEQQAKRYFRQLLEGMAYIHQAGICHRDLKP
jgi:serine/threonine protein kinase